ncbi:MAG: RusA family crossover junction endodeoxyribonuclease [Solobacterium sp.]|nr:RusA family crossover junction endodeoxyribonuclease [Solobacterium sp.]
MSPTSSITFVAEMPKPPTVTAQDHHRVTISKRGKISVYRDQKLQDARQILEKAFMPYAPKTPLEGPLSVTIGLYYPYRKADAKLAKDGSALWKTTRPDLDNSSKEIMDALMSCRFFADDSFVVDLRLYKQFYKMSGIFISIKPAEPIEPPKENE